MVRFTEEAGIVPTSLARRPSAATSTTSAPSTCSSACSSGTTTRRPGCYVRTVWTWRPSGPGSTGWSPRASCPVPSPSDAELLATLGSTWTRS